MIRESLTVIYIPEPTHHYSTSPICFKQKSRVSNFDFDSIPLLINFFFLGKDCIHYLESVCTADIVNLSKNAAVLTVFTNERGGILDDLIITKILDDHFYVVSNAARKEHDQKHLLKALVR